MTDREATFRIVAVSESKPGDLVVEDDDGQRRLYLGSARAISKGHLNADFFDALMRSAQWSRVDDSRRYTLEELDRLFGEGAELSRTRRGRRLAATHGGRR